MWVRKFNLVLDKKKFLADINLDRRSFFLKFWLFYGHILTKPLHTLFMIIRFKRLVSVNLIKKVCCYGFDAEINNYKTQNLTNGLSLFFFFSANETGLFPFELVQRSFCL